MDDSKYVYEFPGYKWQSDRYSYSLPNGESRVFRYDFNNGSLVKLPYTPNKILPDNIANTIPGKLFEITDAKGVTYNFSNNYVVNPATVYISSMISADKTDTIRFTYQTLQNEYYQPSWSSALSLSFLPSVYIPTNINASRQLNWNDSQPISSSISPNYWSQELVPDSIITSSTIVKFSVATGRADMAGTGVKMRVTGITVRRRSDYKLIRQIDFDQTYFG